MAGGHRKVIFNEKCSAKSGNVMVSPKNFTVGLPEASDQDLLQILGLGNVFKTGQACSNLICQVHLMQAKLS